VSLLSWLGLKVKLTDRRFWAEFFGGDTWSGEPINPEIAMQISAFWSCVRLISETIGTLPIGVYQKQSDGSTKELDDHPLYKLVHDQPNADHTAAEFWEGVAAWVCLCGNSFAVKAFQGSGSSRRLIALTLLNSMYMDPRRQSDGSLLYRYTQQPGGKITDYPEDQIFHIRGFGIGGDLGMSPISYGRQTLGANRAAEQAAARTFANGMRPSGWLMWKGRGNLTEAQRTKAKENIINPMSGAENAGKTGILEGEFDYKQMSIVPEAAQLLETRQFGVEEVCRLMRVPPVLVGHSSPGQTMFGAGVEQIVLGWVKLGLLPYLVRIDQAIKRSLISPEDRQKGIYAEFNLEGLLRGDHASRGEFYWKLIQVGAMTPNQVCDKENLPRFDGGDVHLVNTTLAPIELAGQKAAAPDPFGGTAAAPGAAPTGAAPKAVVAALAEEISSSVAFSMRALPPTMPAITVNVPITMPGKRTEVTTIKHDAQGRVIGMEKREREDANV
jgi:HK97 family phage portal protein